MCQLVGSVLVGFRLLLRFNEAFSGVHKGIMVVNLFDVMSCLSPQNG